MSGGEPAHSPYGPSSAERWLNCAASIKATKGMPDIDSDWSIEGTAAHEVVKICSEKDEPAALHLGEKIPVKRVDGTFTNIEVDQEMVNGVQEFLDYVYQFEGMHLSEVRVRYEEYVPKGFGTQDHATLSPGLCRITDFKYGQGWQVYAKENEQLMLYALGTLLEWDWIFNFKRFLLTIHQPRLDHVDEWEISREDLLAWAAGPLVLGYRRTLEVAPAFVPGTWCKFCKIRSTCRARTAAMFEVLQGEFEDLDTLQPTPPAELTLDELAAIHKRFGELKAWMSAVREGLVAAVMQGKKAGDVKLVAGKSAREFIGENKDVVKALVKAGFKKEDIFEEPAIKSVAKIEKLIPKGASRFAPATEKKAAGDLAALIRKVPGKPTLAHAEDPRPALALNVLSEFSDLNEGDD